MNAPMKLSSFTEWLAYGERGISSETIVGHLTGAQFVAWTDHPHDPSDFRRCELLLREVPLARLVFGQMRSMSPVWARLVDAWDELVALGEEDSPGMFTRQFRRLGAPRLGSRLKDLIAGPAGGTS